MYKVVAIVGPTATGKSETGVFLAQKFNGEIINGDSVQVYKQLNIGSAKITNSEAQGIKHHLLDIRNIGEDYTVFDFQKDARNKIEEISKQEKLAIVVGGTGLYIKALLYDYNFVETNRNDIEFEDIDTATLYQQLHTLDPKSCENIHPNNRRRIIRALQMALEGTLKSQQESTQKHELVYDALIIGLTMDRDLLKERIDKRVDKMFENGLLDEVNYINDNYNWTDKGLQAIGYKEFKDYYDGLISLEQTKQLIKTHTKQFVKRQYTWFNNQMDVIWFDVTKDNYLDEISEKVESFVHG